MRRELWDHEFRRWQGRPDALYDSMMMCRDKSWLAVNRGRLSRKELLAASLHDLLPGTLCDEAGRYLSMELRDWAMHGLYRHCFFEGSFQEKMDFMRQLLAEGRRYMWAPYIRCCLFRYGIIRSWTGQIIGSRTMCS